jgi:hypothetical protein
LLTESPEAEPDNADGRCLAKDVNFLKLVPIEVLKDKENSIKVKKLIEYLVNDINEYSTRLFLKHAYG